jgi:hypothetical protein
MPKYQVNDPNTGKKYVITAPDQASAVAAFQKFSGGGSGRPSFNNDAEARAYATDPANRDALNARASQQGALTRPDPRVGLAMPGTPNTTPLKPDPAFDVTNPYSNPLNAVAAFADQAAGSIPIAGPYIQSGRDQLNAGIYGDTPNAARADMNRVVDRNPGPAAAGRVVGSVAPYALAMSNPITAGALGLEGGLMTRLGMTGASQLAINTGDKMARGQSPQEAFGSSIIPSLATMPFALVGKGARLPKEQAAAIETLKREGVPVTGGQARGSRALQQMEGQLGGVAAQNFRDKQLSAYTRAALKAAGVQADNAGPEVMKAAFDKAGKTFDYLASVTPVKVDQALQNDLLKAVTDYEAVSGQSVPILHQMLNRVGELAAQNNGVLKGESYKVLVTDLRTSAQQSANAEVQGALNRMREALDDAVERSANGQTKAAWQKARQNYANLMVVTNAVKGAGDSAVKGLITPESLRSAVSAGNARRYVKGGGDLNELARAGVIGMPRLPDSGTAARLTPLLMMQGGVTHGLQGGDPLVAAGAALGGALAPWATGRAMLSAPGRAMLAKGTNIPAVVARGVTPQLMPPNGR